MKLALNTLKPSPVLPFPVRLLTHLHPGPAAQQDEFGAADLPRGHGAPERPRGPFQDGVQPPLEAERRQSLVGNAL